MLVGRLVGDDEFCDNVVVFLRHVVVFCELTRFEVEIEDIRLRKGDWLTHLWVSIEI